MKEKVKVQHSGFIHWLLLLSLDMLVPNIREWHEKNGDQIFCAAKHTLKQVFLDKSQLKSSSNTVVTLQ